MSKYIVVSVPLAESKLNRFFPQNNDVKVEKYVSSLFTLQNNINADKESFLEDIEAILILGFDFVFDKSDYKDKILQYNSLMNSLQDEKVKVILLTTDFNFYNEINHYDNIYFVDKYSNKKIETILKNTLVDFQ